MKQKYITLSLIASIITTTTAFASQPQVTSKENANLNATDSYWTADRLQNAKPLSIPQIDPRAIDKHVVQQLQNEKSVSIDAMAPTVDTKFAPQQLYKPAESQNTDFLPGDYGAKNEQFSSSQIVPLSADQSYPYTTIGRLYFTKPGIGDYYCSAAVIGKRVLVTAGHCIHNGNGGQSGFYDNWKFVPALRDGSAPLRTRIPDKHNAGFLSCQQAFSWHPVRPSINLIG